MADQDDLQVPQQETPAYESLCDLQGHEALSLWFGLSYASWLTLPRVLMEAMPGTWQGRMAELLFEYDEAYPNQPDIGARVQVVGVNGKLLPMPQWLINYRRPDANAIALLRESPATTKPSIK